MVKQIIILPGKLLNKILEYRFVNWIVSNHITATLALVLIVVFFSFPSYDVAIVLNEMDENWNGIFLQSKEPFTNQSYLHDYGSHGEKLAFRFVPAIFLKILNIETIIPSLLFQFITLILFYYLLLVLYRQFFADLRKAFVFSLPICFVVAGHIYCSDYRGIFDTLALDFILLSLILRKNYYVIFPLLLAYFTDERALIISPVVLLFNMVDKNSFSNRKIIENLLYAPNKFLFLSWIIYIIIRISLSIIFELKTGTGNINLFFEQAHRTFYTFYIGLEGFIIFFIITIYTLIKKGYNLFAFLLFLFYLILFFVSQSVIDINRSMSYLLPVLILISLLADKFLSKEKIVNLIGWIIIINLIYDDFYPLVLQLYRMKFITQTI